MSAEVLMLWTRVSLVFWNFSLVLKAPLNLCSACRFLDLILHDVAVVSAGIRLFVMMVALAQYQWLISREKPWAMERELFASTHQAWVDTKSKFVTSKTLSSISASVSTLYLSTKSSPDGFDAELTMFIYAKGLFGDLNTIYLTILLGSLFGITSDVEFLL